MQSGLKMLNGGAEVDRGFPVRFENPIEDRMIGRRDMLVGLGPAHSSACQRKAAPYTRWKSWRPA